MGRYKVESDGSLTMVAGRGKAEYGASTVRTGTVTTSLLAVGAYATESITFADPMPDDNYLVNLSSSTGRLTVTATNKTKNGFTIIYLNSSEASSDAGETIKYTAFKLYTDTEYNEVLKSMWRTVATVSSVSASGTSLNLSVSDILGKKVRARMFDGNYFITLDSYGAGTGYMQRSGCVFDYLGGKAGMRVYFDTSVTPNTCSLSMYDNSGNTMAFNAKVEIQVCEG